MTSLTDDNFAIVRRMHAHGPMNVEQFKEEFPRVHRPSVRLASLCRHGWLKTDTSDARLYLVTMRGAMAVRDDSTDTTVAEPRRTVTTGNYTGRRETPLREGSEDFLRCPSLIGGERVLPRGARS